MKYILPFLLCIVSSPKVIHSEPVCLQPPLVKAVHMTKILAREQCHFVLYSTYVMPKQILVTNTIVKMFFDNVVLVRGDYSPCMICTFHVSLYIASRKLNQQSVVIRGAGIHCMKLPPIPLMQLMLHLRIH